MPQLQADLARLVGIPSVSVLGFPPETRPALLEARDAVFGLLREAGVETLELLELPDTAPVIVGEIPAPRRSADRSPLRGTTTSSRSATKRSGSRLRSRRPSATGRSSAAARRTRSRTSSCTSAPCGPGTGGRPSGSRSWSRGRRRTGERPSPRTPRPRPDLFAADAMVIGDMGSIRPGLPTLTVGLRGMAEVIVRVRTLAGPKHSGQFGGAAPDALIVLLHALAALHDEHGDVVVPGPAPRGVDRRVVQRRGVPGARRDRCPGVPFVGTGGLGERLWSGPAITVTGMDVLRSTRAVNAVSPTRPCEAQPPGPSGAGRGRGAGRAHATSRVDAPLRDRGRGGGRPRRGRASSQTRPGRRTTPPAWRSANAWGAESSSSRPVGRFRW